MTNRNEGKIQQAGGEEGQAQVDFRQRELRQERWLGFLDTVSTQILALRDGGKTISRAEAGEIRDKVHRLLPDRDFWITRSQMLKDAIIGEDLDEADWTLLWALFGKHSLDTARGARDIIALTDFQTASHKRTGLANLLFEVHKALKQKLASLKGRAKTPEEIARVAAAEKADGEIMEDLWSTRNEAVWNALFAEFRRDYLKPEAKKERAFEEEMSVLGGVRPATPEEAERESRETQGEIEGLWEGVRGVPGERSGAELPAAIPSIRKILSLHSRQLEVKAEQEARQQAPELRLEELGREYDAGELDESAFEERITRVAREMDREEAMVMGRVAMRDARVYRENASDIPRDDRDHGKLIRKAQRLEKIARILLG
ncbi:MAG: hypothetical protein HY434_02730 [Candidatus Liptonbacteria bacterium]|nr:hypothetical protein [Candidatus Liptonbacteria bacterium]